MTKQYISPTTDSYELRCDILMGSTLEIITGPGDAGESLAPSRGATGSAITPAEISYDVVE